MKVFFYTFTTLLKILLRSHGITYKLNNLIQRRTMVLHIFVLFKSISMCFDLLSFYNNNQYIHIFPYMMFQWERQLHEFDSGVSFVPSELLPRIATPRSMQE